MIDCINHIVAFPRKQGMYGDTHISCHAASLALKVLHWVQHSIECKSAYWRTVHYRWLADIIPISIDTGTNQDRIWLVLHNT